MAGQTIPERVAQIYYTYGLFCSSYPFVAIALGLSAVLVCCYPLLNVPLPGNIPTIALVPLTSDFHGTSEGVHHKYNCNSKNCDVTENELIQFDLLQNETLKLPYVWTKDKPLLYIQQIIMKTAVSPWSSNLKMWDAFRAPLQEAFRLLETVRNHEDPDSKNNLANICYQVDSVKRRDKSANEPVMPEYACLVLSPANLWHQNLQAYSLDANIVSNVFRYQNLQKGKVSIAEMAFGMQLRDAGIKRYPLRSRPRVLQYAVTVFYQNLDQKFITSLTKKLKEQYPLYQDTPYTHINEATLVYYPGEFNFKELVPLTITFFGLFLYVYFSVRKIEFIKSKLGLAACAVITIAGSLSMSMGTCFYFGFSLSLQGKEIFPYLLIIVGLENVLVLTKSVTTTDTRLDVKIRLAQGLSKEGWSITMNLLTEITILTVGIFTFVPFIQEFSIFMMVGLISDFFIQILFFATILGIDVRRMECFEDQNKLNLKDYFSSNNALNWRYSKDSPTRMTKSKSHPRLNGLGCSPTDVVAKRKNSPKSQDRVPKRIRLVNLWARTRFFQRAFMVWMLVWISMIVYNSGVVEYFVGNGDKIEGEVKKVAERRSHKPNVFDMYNHSTEKTSMAFLPVMEVDPTSDTNDTVLLKHSPHARSWTRLSPYHWSSILSQYNESIGGRYVVCLPPVLLSHRVAPELAAGLRHPDEREPPPLRWQALAAALDPVDLLPEFEMEPKPGVQWGKSTDLPLYPSTPMEILLLAILCTISIAVIAYMMVVLYRCICSKHYAEWRTSWSDNAEHQKILSRQPAVQVVMEAVPVVVSGHSHEVECLVTDGEKVVSSCLQGTIKVWDSQSGEVMTNIDRASYFKLQKELYDKVHSKKVCQPQSIEALNPPDVTSKNSDMVPKLRKGLTSHLNGLRFRTTAAGDKDSMQLSTIEKTKYNFAKTYRELYCSEDLTAYDCSEVKENIDMNRINTSPAECEEKPFTFIDCEAKEAAEVAVPTSAINESPIWCMDLCFDLIILGCADGRLEFWEASTGKLMYVWWNGEPSTGRASRGVTHVRAISGARRIVAASLSGRLTLLRLDAYNAAAGVRVDWRFSTAYRRTHKRTGSTGSLRTSTPNERSTRTSFPYESSDGEEVECVRIAQCRAHQQPISEMHCEGGRLLTGGQDHVLKVFSSDDLSPLLTLHGHCGPITSCFIDHAAPTIAGSGSQDGMLAVWDLHTGACLYSMQAHDGAVTSLAYTASYVVSAGADERLCVWDRFQGHMLKSVHVGLNYMSRMLPLTHSLVLIGDRGGLTVYDLSSGEVIRRVLLGQTDGCIFVRQILPLKDAIVCDYANQLRIVRFPLVSKLSDFKNE